MSNNPTNGGAPDLLYDTPAAGAGDVDPEGAEPERDREAAPRGRARAEAPAVTAGNAHEPGTALVLGPKGSGKTSLLLGLAQGCYLAANDGFTLRLTVEGESAWQLLEHRIRVVLGGEGGPRASHDTSEYVFRIDARRAGSWLNPVEGSVRLALNDGPGGALFPAEDREQAPNIVRHQELLVAAGRRASTMVFCVDASSPRVDVLQTYLPGLLSRMSRAFPRPARAESAFRRVLRTVRGASEPSHTPAFAGLNVDRFLLVLTKIDRFVTKVDPDRRIRRAPVEFAASLDPVDQARSLLGDATLNIIDQHLTPHAQFAIGVSSSWGFDPMTGAPSAGSAGITARLDAEGDDEVLARWRPFGAREAAIFLATGADAGPVHLVDREALGRPSRAVRARLAPFTR